MSIVITCAVPSVAPTDMAFTYVSDHRSVPEWLFGVIGFTPTTSQVSGIGATFDTAVSLGITIRSRVTITEWSNGRVMAFESVKGFKNTSRWEITEGEGGGSLLAAEVRYELPLGPAGKALGRTIEPFVAAAVRRSAANLQGRLDALTPTRG